MAAMCRKELVEIRVVDDSPLELSFDFQPYRDAEEREAMRIVCRPIQRIYDPCMRPPSCFGAALLRQDRVRRKGLQDAAHNELFSGNVDFRNQIDVAFVCNGKIRADVFH